MAAIPQSLPAANDPADQDPIETREWLDALETVIEREGPERAHFLLEQMLDVARRSGANIPFANTTGYVNTIPTQLEAPSPGNAEFEERIRSFVRWNAMAMVVRANKHSPPDGGDLGGHIASFASLATMIGTGMNHFWRAPHDGHGGDLIYFQGHSSPGLYGRAFLEGRLTEEQLNNFRQEVDGKGLSSYPHPKLMPDFWQFPTVSMGLGPLMAIYQARFLKYLHARGIADTSNRKVWVFCGDGEMDEPESKGAIGLAAREKLDNLIFIINCNLQRLDGPVRGNGKIIQELEGDFRGAGWNVIKLIWGSYWDPLAGTGHRGHPAPGDGRDARRRIPGLQGQRRRLRPQAFLRQASEAAGDGLAHDRRRCLAPEPRRTRSAQGLRRLPFGRQHGRPADGHPRQDGQGLRDGSGRRSEEPDAPAEEARVRRHQGIPRPLQHPDSRRQARGDPVLQAGRRHAGDAVHARAPQGAGRLPAGRRRMAEEKLKVPDLEAFRPVLEPTAEGREISTTQAFVRLLTLLIRDREIGARVVPIVPDEARTFGMEGMFRQLGIYAPGGQMYTPVDKDQVMYYKEDAKGQILEEGINEAGAFSSWIAAATSYSSNNRIMVPFYIYYSMFGFQRVGDLAWAAGDMQARGFLLGGTSGRTTLNGEGLQHEDGHSHVLSSTIPNCVSYDPTYAHEVAVIIQHGLRRMVEEQENVFYYLTVMNENYAHPGLKPGDEENIIKGMYLLKPAGAGDKPKSGKAGKDAGKAGKDAGEDARVQLLGCGVILREVIAAAELLQSEWNVSADVWSVPSFTELRREGMDCERWNLLHPGEQPKVPFVTQQLDKHPGPVVASTDYMKIFSDQIRAFIPKGRAYVTLGTDGYGRSDFRAKLREHFEVNRHFVVLAALKALAQEGKVPAARVGEAIKRYGLNPEKANPARA